MFKLEYKLVQAKLDENWDKFVDNSINGTIFSKSYYLKATNSNYKLFYCYKKKELRAAIAVVESEDKKNIILNNFIIYNGIMYNKPTNKQNHSQQLSEQFKIQTFIAEEFTRLYKNIEMSLHPSLVDIRAFLWVNYGEDKSQYKPELRYTTYINISDFNTSKNLKDISLYKKASVSRRQQIRYAIKKDYVTKVINDIDIFINFYNLTMKRQNINAKESTLKQMKSLMQILINNNVAKLYASYNELDEISSMAFFGFDNKRAYYIFGANNPEKRDGHSGTNVLWEAFYDLNKIGINEVDLEGVNSPKRGWFKLSFGGDIMPYYKVKLML